MKYFSLIVMAMTLSTGVFADSIAQGGWVEITLPTAAPARSIINSAVVHPTMMRFPSVAGIGKNDNFSREFFFSGGVLQVRNHGDARQILDPNCSFLVHYSDDDIEQMDKTGRYPLLLLKSPFKISQTSFVASGEVGHVRVSSIHFAVNKNVVALGQRLSYENGKLSESRLMSVDCEGNNLQAEDLENSFAGHAAVDWAN